MDPKELRHELHRYPEVFFKEKKTTEILINALEDLERQYPGSLTIKRPLETGMVIERKTNSGRYVLIRADIDALAIKEETSSPFSSLNTGFMHACGHDVHMAGLYATIKKILEENIDQNFLFVFQPAEEGGGGAEKMLSTGIFDSYDIAYAMAMHVTDEYPRKTVASTRGLLFASATEVDVQFIGRSAHVALAQDGRNAFTALRSYLDYTDMMPKSFKEPVLYANGKMYAGSVRNIIPDYAKLEGSIRAFSIESGENFYRELSRILENVSAMTGVKGVISKGSVYSEVLVDGKLYEKAEEILSEDYAYIDCGYKMTGEDFGFFSKKYPSFMFWLGTRCVEERFGLHNSRFIPDDEVIDDAADIFMKLIRGFGGK